MSLPDHFFVGEAGDLYDTRVTNWVANPLRTCYCCTFSCIETTAQLLATLRRGPYAWPGSYPMFFLTGDGAALAFGTVRQELSQVVAAVRDQRNDGWCVCACEVNWEDSELTDDHTGLLIESAYGNSLLPPQDDETAEPVAVALQRPHTAEPQLPTGD